MDIEETMWKAVLKQKHVLITDKSGKEYKGLAYNYTQADDEEDEIPTISVETENDGCWGIRETEIAIIEIIDYEE